MLPEDWKQFTQQNVARALREQQNSIALRDGIDELFKDAAAQSLAQANAVEAAFNARILQYTDALNQDKTELTKVPWHRYLVHLPQDARRHKQQSSRKRS